MSDTKLTADKVEDSSPITGRELKVILEDANVTPSELAERLGVSQAAMSYYLNKCADRTLPKRRSRPQIAEAVQAIKQSKRLLRMFIEANYAKDPVVRARLLMEDKKLLDADRKQCPRCAEHIKLAAIYCRFCQLDLLADAA